MQSGYNISHLSSEAQTRWLKPVEVLFILQNYEEHQITHQIPQKPAGGSLYLFNKKKLKFFRKDGHGWRRRKDQRAIAEAHERLKVGNDEALNCYYAHGEENRGFQRRSYWMLDPEHEHIVLVHYRDTGEARQNSRSASQVSKVSSTTFSHSPNSFATPQPDLSFVFGEHNELHQDQSCHSIRDNSCSEIIKNPMMNHLDVRDRTDDVDNSSTDELNQALRLIEHQLSLNDDETKESNTLYMDNERFSGLEDYQFSHDLSGQTSSNSDDLLFYSDDGIQQHQLPWVGVDNWKDMLDSSNSLPHVESGASLGRNDGNTSSTRVPFEVESLEYVAHAPVLNTYGMNSNCLVTLCDQGQLGISLEDNLNLTNSLKKFTIQEISPAWCYSSDSEGAKIIIIGSFLCDPSEVAWACMFGDIEVPVQIIQTGVICCHAPSHLPGKVTLCITTGNGESCSEVKEFEYRAEPKIHSIPPEREDCKNLEDLLLLVRFVQMLLSDPLAKEHVSETRAHPLTKPETSEDVWNQVVDAILIGTSTSSSTLYWILQEVLKVNLDIWLSSRSFHYDKKGCSLSKKEQGIIHMASGLGFEWALQPILGSGVNVNFRDFSGWTALHWAAKFGREKMVADLIASGASAGAITDPTSQEPTGKTTASIAASRGHKGLAGYLSEAALTSHLSSLVLEEGEMSQGYSASNSEEKAIYSTSSTSTIEDQDSLKYSLGAYRNASQAAARIQSAFRAHSFRLKRQREAAAPITGACEYNFNVLENDIQGLSAASKLAFGRARDSSAALSIQKRYRGWKGRKGFLSLRQKVVKIQAHVRGYQVRKKYNVRWAVGILEKAVLRWRRRGVGFRGFQLDSDFIDETEDEDILRVFRKQNVEAVINEAVSTVLAMVECPTARQQYGRILAKYRQAKAELQCVESQSRPSRCIMSSYHVF